MEFFFFSSSSIISIIIGALGSVVVKALSTSRKVVGSRPDEVKFFNLSNPSGRTRPWSFLSL
jgi:hypothetical protein